MQAESRIGALWQQRMDALREYSVVRDGNVFGAGLAGSCLFSSEYTGPAPCSGNWCRSTTVSPLPPFFPGPR